MIPEAVPFNEWYSGPNQLQVFDAVGYQSVDIQVNWMLAVMYRHGGATALALLRALIHPSA
jgi:hypothetical protein